MKCPFKIFSVYNIFLGKILVKNVNHEHNHVLSKEIFEKVYPKHRRLSEIQINYVKSLLNYNVKKTIIKNECLSKYQKFLTIKDIHNIQQKNSDKKESISYKIQKIGREFASISGNIFHIEYSEKSKDCQAIYIEPSASRELYSNFPEVLLCDVTYKTNSSDMPLMMFLGQDIHGVGRVIASIFIANETTSLFETSY